MCRTLTVVPGVAGIVWARYCRDAFRKWFAVHIGVQITGAALLKGWHAWILRHL